MRNKRRILWAIVMLLSIGWIIAGTLITAEVIDGSSIDEELTAEIKSLTADIMPADLPLATLFLVTGLPLAGIAFYFYRRAGSPTKRQNYGSQLRRQTMLITILALLFALLLWNMGDVENLLNLGNSPTSEAIGVLMWPVRLFVTFVHEAGHSLAALISGGQVHSFAVSPNGSGVATTAGGNRALILPAGYLGAALFGSLLFYLTNRIPEWTPRLSFFIGISIVLLTLTYALSNITTFLVGIGFGLGILALGWFAHRGVNVFVLNTLAILTGLNALFDLIHLIRITGVEVGDDAAKFSQEITPLLSPSVVAAIWAAIAVGLLAAAVYYGLIKTVGGEIAQAVRSDA